MSFFDPRQRVREARVPENYRCIDPGGGIDEGEEMHCFVCGFSSRAVGTLSYVWERTNQYTTPPSIELCEFCHQAASEQRV